MSCCIAGGPCRQRRLQRVARPTADANGDMVRRPNQPCTPVEAFRDHLDRGGLSPDRLRLLTFQRSQRAEARRRWPDLHSEPDDEHFRAAELRWRELADRGVPSIRVVPGVVDELIAFANRIGAPPTDPTVRAEFAQSLPRSVEISWPPPRNAPCWCGSGTKYKKCCGACDDPSSTNQRSSRQ